MTNYFATLTLKIWFLSLPSTKSREPNLLNSYTNDIQAYLKKKFN